VTISDAPGAAASAGENSGVEREAGIRLEMPLADDSFQQSRFQDAGRRFNVGFVSGEQLSRASIAYALQSALSEGFLRERDGTGITIGIACDLAGYPVGSFSVRKEQHRPKFAAA